MDMLAKSETRHWARLRERLIDGFSSRCETDGQIGRLLIDCLSAPPINNDDLNLCTGLSFSSRFGVAGRHLINQGETQ